MSEELDRLLDDIAKLEEVKKLCEDGYVIELRWNPEDKWVEVAWSYPTEEARERDRLRTRKTQ